MLRTWISMLILAAVVLAAGNADSNRPGGAMFCVNASDLGLASSPPDLVASVFEKGRWRPAEIYVEPEEVIFVAAPFLNNTKIEAVQKIAERGVLPPASLKNHTKICLEAARGTPQKKPPGGGTLYKLQDEKGAIHHVFISRPQEVEDHINFTMAIPAKATAPRARVVEFKRYSYMRPETYPMFYHPLNKPVSMNYLAVFKSRYFNYTRLSPYGCTSAVIDLPAETYQLILAFNTPGAYSYTIYRNGILIDRGGVAVGVEGRLVPVSSSSGRATYRVQICNQDRISTVLDISFLVDVRGQMNYPRVDVVSTPRTGISLRSNQPLSTTSRSLYYVYLPGYAIDAVETNFGAYVLVEARLPQKAVILGTLYIYWGGVYIGSLTGSLQPDGYYYFRGSLRLTPSHLQQLLPTLGRGGSIMLGPIDLSNAYNSAGYVAVDVLVHRPIDLAPANDSLYYYWLTPRFRYVFNYHAIEYVHLLTDGFYRGMSYRVEVATGSYQGNKRVAISVGRYDWGGKVLTSRYDDRFKFYIKAANGDGSPANILVFNSNCNYHQPSSGGVLAELIMYISTALSLSDLIKSTIDALKGTVSGLPIVGYIVILLETAVAQVSGVRCLLEQVNTNTVSVMIRPYGAVPGAAGFSYETIDNAVLYISKVEVWRYSITPAMMLSVDLGSQPIVATQYGPPAQPRGTITWPMTGISYFPYRTLACDFQHPAGIPSDIPTATLCRGADFR